MTASGKENYWGRFARSYDEDAAYVVGGSLRRAVGDRLRAEQGLGDVVEFGCGTGYFTKAIAGGARHVIATDLSDEMLEAARRQLSELPNVTIQKDDCERPSFPSCRFHTVLMANVLHTIEDPRRALAESHRILKERGVLLIVCYTDYGTNWFEKMALGLRYFQKFGMPPSWYRNYSPDELSDLVEDAGFTVEENELLSDTAKALYVKARKK